MPYEFNSGGVTPLLGWVLPLLVLTKHPTRVGNTLTRVDNTPTRMGKLVTRVGKLVVAGGDSQGLTWSKIPDSHRVTSSHPMT